MDLPLKGCSIESTNILLSMDHDSGYVEGSVMSEAFYNQEQDESSEGSVQSRRHSKIVEPPFTISEDALLETPQFGALDSCFLNAIDEETRRQLFSPDQIISSSVTTEKSDMGLDGFESEGASVTSSEIPFAEPIVVLGENFDNSLIDYKQDDQVTDLSINHTLSDMSLEQSTNEPIIFEQTNVDDVSTNSDVSDMSVGNDEEKHRALTKNDSINGDDNKNTENDFNIPINDTIGLQTRKNIKNLDAGVSTINVTKISPEIPCRIEHSENVDCSRKTEVLEQSPVIPNSKRELTSEFIFQSPKNICDKVKNSEGVCDSVSPKEKRRLLFNSPVTGSPKEKRRLTLIFSKSEKENYVVKRKYPSLTPEKKPDPVDPNMSPELFTDDNIDNLKSKCVDSEHSNISMDVVDVAETIRLAKGISRQPFLFSPSNLANNERFVNSLDRKLLLRVQKGLSGVLPPPSMTVVNLSVSEILSRLEENKVYFWNNADNLDDTKEMSLNSSEDSNPISKSLLVNMDDVDALKGAMDFPEILEQRYHGVHYNHSKIAEEIANLCEKYAKRFVGAETQSSCTVFEQPFTGSPSKRRATKPKWGTKSPGRRLSHLARRRITFSSANLQAGGSSLAGSRARQILVDARKMELLNLRKSPKKTPKKTPSKSPRTKTRTPSSSAKKKLALRFRKVTGEIEKSLPPTSEPMSSKRALFKSPDKTVKNRASSISSRWSAALSKTSPNAKRKVPSTSDSILADPERSQLRRALFTSPKKDSPSKIRKSPLKKIFGAERKRKRAETEEEHPSKFPRSMSCLEVQPTVSSESSIMLSRTRSDVNLTSRSHGQIDLNDLQKKKLQWAVYEALRSQNIQPGHPQFKVFAAVLARVTRRFFSSLMNSSPSIGSTTDRMLRMARHHVFAVIKGKTSDEIVSEHLKTRAKLQKPQGYVAPLEEVNNLKNTEIQKAVSGPRPGVLQDRANTIESWEKKKLEQLSKPSNDSKIERIRKVINFGDDR